MDIAGIAISSRKDMSWWERIVGYFNKEDSTLSKASKASCSPSSQETLCGIIPRSVEHPK